jgi:hypothetical protein
LTFAQTIRKPRAVTAVWRNDGDGWDVLEPAKYADEAHLHDLIEQAPQVLPLSGSPELIVVGREVACGPGSADLVAVEKTGRPVVIEVKLRKNPEARRAVVAQVLSYASYLRGLTVEGFESILQPYLTKVNASSIVDRVVGEDQSGLFDPESFRETLAGALETGGFRLVLVLDAAPADLVQLVGYLEEVSSEQIAVDLVVVSSYSVGATQLLVPQRLDPAAQQRPTATTQGKPQAVTVQGAEGFEEAILTADLSIRPELQRLTDWALGLDTRNLATLFTSHGQGRKTLVARVKGADAGLATVWNDNGAYLTVYRSVFERLAPTALATLEALGVTVGQGNSLKAPSSDVLDALTNGYFEAIGLVSNS